MLEIDFDQVKAEPADVDFYAQRPAPVKIPPYLAVRCLNAEKCQDCADDAPERLGLIAWVAVRQDNRSPTHWVVLCDEHFERTTRKKPLIFP